MGRKNRGKRALFDFFLLWAGTQIVYIFRVIQEKLPNKIAISPDSHLPCDIYKYTKCVYKLYI